MAITFELVELTPSRLRYLATSDGTSTLATDTGTIPNSGGVSPDLQTDATNWFQHPMYQLVTTAVTSIDEARQLLQGAGLTTVGDLSTARGRIYILPQSTVSLSAPWSADPSWVLGNDFAVINVIGPNGTDSSAYIEIIAQHSYDR
jgi:hypothetical protein